MNGEHKKPVELPSEDHRVYRDMACFSKQQWFVRGHPYAAFTTESDAVNALKLAATIAEIRARELADQVREVLP